MKNILWSILSAFVLLSCTPGEPTQLEEGLVVSAPMVRAPLGGQTTTAGYFTITNHTDLDDVIIDVSSNDAERVEIHETKDSNGVMRMRKRDAINIPAGGSLKFEPGGFHLMIFGVNLEKDQKDIQLTLKFQNAPDLSIIAEIVEMTPMNASGHH